MHYLRLDYVTGSFIGSVSCGGPSGNRCKRYPLVLVSDESKLKIAPRRAFEEFAARCAVCVRYFARFSALNYHPLPVVL